VGYDVHITRADEWSDNADAPISLDDWKAVAETEADLVADPRNGDGFFLARGLRDDGGDGWFDWYEGDVFTKDPDRPTLAKMLSLAARLNARVQGDEGELYRSPDDL
jgi:hypothetical protein